MTQSATFKVRVDGTPILVRPVPGGGRVLFVEGQGCLVASMLSPGAASLLSAGDKLRATFDVKTDGGRFLVGAFDYAAPIEVAPLKVWQVLVDLVVCRAILGATNPTRATPVVFDVAKGVEATLQLAIGVLDVFPKPPLTIGKNHLPPIVDALRDILPHIGLAAHGTPNQVHDLSDARQALDRLTASACKDVHLVEAIRLLAPTEQVAKAALAIDRASWIGPLSQPRRQQELDDALTAIRAPAVGLSRELSANALALGHEEYQQTMLY